MAHRSISWSLPRTASSTRASASVTDRCNADTWGHRASRVSYEYLYIFESKSYIQGIADLLLCLLEGHAQALRLALGLGEGLLQALAVPVTSNAGT